MSTPTAARTLTPNSSHWYTNSGEPCYQLPKADGKGTKVPTLADARKLNLVPSVTTILDAVLRKPGLESWKTEQAVMACLTAPRKEGEEIDAFVKRVLQEEKQQSQEAAQAADLGTRLHDALAAHFTGQAVPDDLKPWIMPAAEAISKYGSTVASEKILVGAGYAGRTDLILESESAWWIWDFKTTKSLPDPKKGAWDEHVLQCAAYAGAYRDLLFANGVNDKVIRTANAYISSIKPGSFVICEHENWQPALEQGFMPIVTHWQWKNQYWPEQPGRVAAKPVLQSAVVAPVTTAVQPTVEKLPSGKKVAWTKASAPTAAPIAP